MSDVHNVVNDEIDGDFQEALSFHKQDREKKEKSRSEGFRKSFDPLDQVALEPKQDKVIRVVSGPFRQMLESGDMVFKRNHNWDAKPIHMSRIIGDTGKQFRCIWPHPSTNLSKTWILWRIYREIMKRERSTGDDPVYTYKEKFPLLFERVAKNGKSRDAKGYTFESGWKQSYIIVLNVIDRADSAFHTEKKHTKLLSKKVSEGLNGTFYYEAGVPFESVYELGLMLKLVKSYGSWRDYDVAIRKHTGKPYYEVFHGVHHRLEIQENKRPLIKEGLLTDEEKAYEKYDLDKLFPITRYSTIKYHLGVFIESVDQALNTKFYDELLTLVEEEKKNQPQKEEESETATEVVNEAKPLVRESATAKVETDLFTGEIPWDKLADGSYNGKVYKGVPLMTEAEKSMVKGIHGNGLFKYSEKDPDGAVVVEYEFGEKETFFKSPGYFHVCPFNGELFNEVD